MTEHASATKTDDSAPAPEDVAHVRASYPMLEGGITMGTICEYQPDEWTWVVVTDLPDWTWGEVFDEDDRDADERVLRFLNLEQLPDDDFILFEDCVGCREHCRTARLFQDHEGAGNYMRRSDFLAKFEPLGPLHPNFGEGDSNADE